MEGAEKPKFGKERGFNEPPALTAPTPPAVEPGKAATAPLPPVDLKAWASDPKNLTPEQLERVTEAAKREGVSLESKLKFLYENQPKGKVFVKPLSTEADPVKPKGTAFELAFGDSIAAQQVRHGVPGTEGPMGGTSLLPTAVVGDSPQKVLRRMQAQDGASVSGKTMFLSTGASNDPSQVELVGNQLDYLKANGVGAVVVPGVGPGVKDSAAVNAKLKALTEARGFTYFAPPADSWQKDGIHPRAAVAFGKLALASIPQATPVSGNGGEDLTADVRKLLTDTLSKAPSSSGGSKIDMSDIEAVLRRSVRRAPSAKLMGTFTASVLKDNPAAAALLDFVARPESGGNYNAVIGNGASTQDLSKMSLGEVMALQKALVAQGRESGAIGRYQIINQTLRGLVSELGLSTSEKFTPELQDRLGFALLERRGYSAWKAGQLSDVQFAHNLALEWAAIPSPKTGLSAYQGVGSNRAGVAMHSVFSTLRDLFPRK
jgi:muramidase (phage lysozyme)